jgi:iron complex transport system substrate-binding protein
MRKLLIFSLILFFAAGAGAYERIISLAPSVTKSLYLLGLEKKVVGITLYCPPGSGKKEIIGSVLEPNVEKIALLKPDLVIVSKEGNRQQTAEKLTSLGLRIYIMNSVDNFADICSEFTKLGEFTGRGETAKAVVADSRKRISALGEKLKNTKPPRVFWEVGSQPLFTVSGKSFVNDFIELGGGVNIFADAGPRYPEISREEVLKRDPDVIIMVTMGDVTVKEMSEWRRFPALKAVKTGRIYVLHDAVFTDPTPVGIAAGAEMIARLLHE